jgi:hypothetical protein
MAGSHLRIPRNENVISKTELYCSVSQFLHSNICERFTYFQDPSACSAAGKYVDWSWEYIAHRHINVEIGTEAAQFPGKEYINGIFLAVCTSQSFQSQVAVSLLTNSAAPARFLLTLQRSSFERNTSLFFGAAWLCMVRRGSVWCCVA